MPDESPFIEALKYDERIWRAFLTLKTVHREGFLEALAKASGDEIQRLTGALEMRKPSQVADLEEALAAMTKARDALAEIAEAATFAIDNVACVGCRNMIDNIDVECIDALRKVGAT